MDEDRERLSLTTIQEGALIEQFDRALDLIVQNLADINTTIKAREIVLTVQFKPNEDRSFLEITGAVKSKAANQKEIKTTADLTYDDRGRSIAFNRVHKQMGLPFNVKRFDEKGV